MKHITKIIEYLIYAVLVFMALLVLASALPIPGGVKTFVVRSGSMEPKIKTGSVVVVLPKDDYSAGDVITFGPNTRTETPTTHRITEESGSKGLETYITKGDANEDRDLKQVRQAEVIGKVRFSIPWLGYIVAAAKKPWGFAVIVGVPAVLFVFDQAKSIWEEIRKMKAKKKEELNNNNNNKQTDNK